MLLHRLILSLNQSLPATNKWLVLSTSVPVALATGTLFVYSSYSTQLAEQCGLDATSTGILNIVATLGSAVGAVLSGFVSDMYGSQIPILATATFLGSGYFWLWSSYNAGKHSSYLGLLLAMFLVGLGSVSGYFACLKAVAVNFPDHKGLAQSVTIASFAISALIFLVLLRSLGDTGHFLVLLSATCAVLALIGFIFIRVEGHIDNDDAPDEGLAHDIREEFQFFADETAVNTPSTTSLLEEQRLLTPNHIDTASRLKLTPELSSVLSLKHLSLKQSLKHPIFWYHYGIFSITQGFGQMYIYSVGFILKAIHLYYSQKQINEGGPEVTIDLRTLQTIHVSIVAVSSFLGRLTSGPVSDLVARHGYQRHWMLILGSGLMITGHLSNLVDIGATFEDIGGANTFLLMVSLLIGFAYGFTFTCYPVIVSDLFSMKNYSVIWGCTYTSTTLGLTLMSKIFGYVYDKNSQYDNGQYVCEIGSKCYSETFIYTSGLNVLIIGLVFAYIYSRSRRV